MQYNVRRCVSENLRTGEEKYEIISTHKTMAAAKRKASQLAKRHHKESGSHYPLIWTDPYEVQDAMTGESHCYPIID